MGRLGRQAGIVHRTKCSTNRFKRISYRVSTLFTNATAVDPLRETFSLAFRAKSDITLISISEDDMDEDPKPLSQLVGQGWEIVGTSSFADNSGRVGYSVLLRRHRQHKLLTLKTRFLGKGLSVDERDV
jgi:hypothetical protein